MELRNNLKDLSRNSMRSDVEKVNPYKIVSRHMSINVLGKS